MDEENNELENAAKKGARKAGTTIKGAIKGIIKRKQILLIVTIVIAIVLLVAAAREVLKINGVENSKDPKNGPAAVTKHFENISIDENGNITSQETVQSFWDKLKEAKNTILDYLDSPEELAKLMNAQKATEYLDTRPNPEEEINWDEINTDVNSAKVQGIVKLKRALSDGNTIYMTYKSPEEFNKLIQKYNTSGKEEDKKEALKYFTIDKSIILGTGSGTITGTASPITAGTTINIPSGLGKVHTYMGWQKNTATGSTQYKLREKAGMNFDSEGFGKINGRYVIACTAKYGTVGDYVDFYQEDGSIISCIIGDIKDENDAGCNEWGHQNGTCIVEFVVNKTTWYSGHANPGTSSCHPEWHQYLTKAINGGSYFDNPTFGADTITSNATTTSDEPSTGDNVTIDSSSTMGLMKWPTDGTRITSYFGKRAAPVAGASTDHGAIDIGVPVGTNVYACEAGKVIFAGSSGNAGKLVTIDHGNGYVSKYMHNSEFRVSVGDVVNKGDLIALSGATGNVSGPHVHFQIEKDGTKVDPLSFKYDNGMGDGTAGIGSSIQGTSTSGTTSTTSQYVAKVATWSEHTDIVSVSPDDPDETEYSSTTYYMSSTEVPYQQLVSKYTMPFNYLWAFLVVSKDKDFVFDLAQLVYDSKIEITVHDNEATTTNLVKDTYTKNTKIETNADVIVTYEGTKTVPRGDEYIEQAVRTTSSFPGEKAEKTIQNKYIKIATTIDKNNTVEYALTLADVWFVKYEKKYTYEGQKRIADGPTSKKLEDIPETEGKQSGDPGGLEDVIIANVLRKANIARTDITVTNKTATIQKSETKYYHSTIDRNRTTTNSTVASTYISSPENYDDKEKTNKSAKEPNFVSIFAKNYSARTNILGLKDLLFEILDSNENTKDMVDLTKYLFYKTTGVDYGITEFDFSTYNPSAFIEIGSSATLGGNVGWEFTKSYENLALWKYMSKNTGTYNSVSKYVSEDKKSYLMFSDGNKNFGFGLCFYNTSSGTFNHKNYFSQKGIDITSTQYQSIGAKIDAEIIDWISLEVWKSNKEDMKKKATNAGVTLEEYQIDVLTDIAYQYGPNSESITNILNAYKQNGLNESAIKNSSSAFTQWGNRSKNRLYLFMTGKYIAGDGEVLDPAKYSSTVSGSSIAVANGTSAQKLAYLFPNGTPTTASGCLQYMQTITVPLTTKAGQKTTGQLTVHRAVVEDVKEVFQAAQDAGFKIYSAAGYSFRRMNNGSSSSLSHHSYGIAIDINVNENYSRRGSTIYAGSFWDPSRSEFSIPKDGVLVKAFEAKGWKWGGNWSGNYQDYMHFSFTGH